MEFGYRGGWSIDLMCLLAFCDEYTDLKPVSYVEEKVNLAIDAIKNAYKPRPEGEDPSQMARESVHLPSHDVQYSHVLDSSVPIIIDDLDKKCREALRRVVRAVSRGTRGTQQRTGSVNTIEYLPSRRLNSACALSNVSLELHLDLPDEALNHLEIKEMELLCIDMIVIDNTKSWDWIFSCTQGTKVSRPQHNSESLAGAY